MNGPCLDVSCSCNTDKTMDNLLLRDYFAAHALAALIAKTPVSEGDRGGHDVLARSAAAGAYDYADAMIRERER